MTTKDTAFKKITSLVERFDEQKDSYKRSDYNETLTRRDFIDPFFKALGWDIDNEQGYAESYREVIHEDKIKISGATKAPDYAFRLSGGKRLFFVEAKKPSVLIKDDITPAYQVRRYGWSAKLPISIITDFEEFAVYDCTKKPNPSDKASHGRIKYLTYSHYLNEFDFIWDTFSKEKVLKGSFDKYVSSDKQKRGTSTVDKEFLASLDNWRTSLASNIALRNDLDADELNFVVQSIIDRIIFLRIAEDRSVEPYGSLKGATTGEDYYQNLLKQFHSADQKYNSGLFDFRKDKISGQIAIDNKVVKGIVSDLYYPASPYEFSVIPVEILGSAYEQFLGKTINLSKSGRAVIEEKPEVRKAGGVYYTPQYIVDYIVKNTVGRLIEGKKPEQISKIKVVDPACGSGSFLIGAYDFLLQYHKDYYTNNGKPSKGSKGNPLTPDGNLTTAEKKRILLNNIFGVDLDANAVEVTKLSLLLKCMEGETEASINTQLKLFHERVLPTLDDNIKCGNSLIDVDFYESEIDFGEEKKIKPFNWQKAFTLVFKQGGFDAVIGNPPYVPIEFFSDLEKQYYRKSFPEVSRKYDTSVLFKIKGLKILCPTGLLGYISTQTWQTGENYSGFRKMIFDRNGLISVINLPYDVFKDAYVDTGIFIATQKKQKWYKYYGYSKKAKIDSIKELKFKTIGVDQLNNSDYKLVINSEATSILKRLLAPRFKNLGDISMSTQGLSASRFTRTNDIGDKFTLPFIQATIKRYRFEKEDEYYVSLQNQKSLLKFYAQTDKILIRRIINRQDRLDATYFNKAGVFKKDVNPFIITDQKFDAKYVLGIVNSKLFSWLYINTSSIATKDDFRQTTLAELRNMPIPVLDGTSGEIAKWVESLIRLNEEIQGEEVSSKVNQIQSRIDYYEQKINDLVYQLYGLTEEEISIVEGNEVLETS